MQKTRKRNRHLAIIICGLFISVANFIVFWLYINIDTVISTFQVPDYAPNAFWYYKNVIRDIILGGKKAYEGALGHTFIAMLINVIIFPIALITAYTFYKRVYGEKIFRVVFYLPSIIAITTLTMSFRELFLDIARTGSDGVNYTVQGPITLLLKAFGYKENVSLSMLSAAPGTFAYDNFWFLVIFFCVFTGLGTNVVLMCGAMMRIPTDVNEALRIDGCGFFTELWKVSIPMIMPTISTWLIMVVTSVFGFSITPMLLAGLTPGNAIGSAPGLAKTSTIPLAIYVNMLVARGDPNIVTKQMQALGVVFSLMVMPLVFLVRYICNKLTPDISY